MLELKQVSYTYDKRSHKASTLGPVDLKVEPHEICAIIGPSGCGKSTLLHLVARLIEQQTGEVLLNEVPLCAHRDHISFVPQNLGLLPWKDVRHNCLLPFAIKKQPVTKEVEARLMSICTRLGIDSLLNRYPHELSGGQKQRVALARSFTLPADLLLMDEPFSALDPLTKEKAMHLFLELWSTYKMPTLFVTHHIDEALYIGQKIIVMGSKPGRVIKILENPLFQNNSFKATKEYGEIVYTLQECMKEGQFDETI